MIQKELKPKGLHRINSKRTNERENQINEKYCQKY
jgi:hypothetical protein